MLHCGEENGRACEYSSGCRNTGSTVADFLVRVVPPRPLSSPIPSRIPTVIRVDSVCQTGIPAASACERRINPQRRGVAWPWSSLPQHTAVPSARIPQECLSPLPMDTKVSPAGGDMRRPQHTAEPSPLRPQVWRLPLLREVNFSPSGGSVCP